MTTISISKSKNRSSQSLATLPLENFAQQRLPSSNESNVSGISSVSAHKQTRHSGELPVRNAYNVKADRRRARSTFGGGEDYANCLDFAAGSASQPDENRPVLFFTSKGLNESGFGRVGVQSTRFPKPTAAPPPAKEKQGLIGKSGARSVQGPKIEGSLSERSATTEIASKTIPLPEIYLPPECPLRTHGTQCNLPSGGSDTNIEVVCELYQEKQGEEIDPCTVEKRPSESPTAGILDEKCASPEINPRTSSSQDSHDDESFVEEHQVAATVDERSRASQEMDPRTSLQERDGDGLVQQRRAAAILHQRRASRTMDPSTSLQERDDGWFVEEQQDATISCQSGSVVGEQGMQQAELFGQDDVETESKATIEEDPSSVLVEASEMARMEELSRSAFDAELIQSSSAEIAALIELLSDYTSPEQSSGSLAHHEPSNVVEKVEHVIIASEASTPDLQEANELGANQVVNESAGNLDSHVCFPTPSLLQSSETSRVSDLFLEDGSQPNGSQNMHNRTPSLEQQETERCTELQENKKGTVLLHSAAAQDSLDLSPVLSSLGSESSSTTVMHMRKMSMNMSTDESCSSSRWTSDSAVSSKLPDADHQELNLSSEPGAANEKRFSASQHVQYGVPFITGEKVTEEQLTEAAFLSNLDYHGKEATTVRCASSLDLQQSRAAAAALTNRMNAFRSKSTGRYTPKLADRENLGFANAYSDSEQCAMVTVSAANQILSLEQPQVCSSRFSKVDLNSCHNVHDRVLPTQFLDVILTGSARHQYGLPKKNLRDDDNNNHQVITSNEFNSPTEKAAAAEARDHPDLELHLNSKGNGERTSPSGLEDQLMKDIVQDEFPQEENSKGTVGTALKPKKIETRQNTTLMENSAFSRAVAEESAGLASERSESESESLHKVNADHVIGSFDPVISTANGIQLQIESKTKPMNAECQQQNRADFLNATFGMVQAMSSSNPVSKLASLMAKPTLEGNVMLNNIDKPQSIREMFSVSPRQSLEDYRMGPSSIYILGNPSFSSSHQDRLWEEQAEAYSSGGRGTPGRDDTSTAAVFLAPRPASAVSGDVLLPSSASLSARKGASEATVVPASADTSLIEKGKSQSGKKRKAKKMSKPRTQLQSLLADEIKGKDSDRNSVNWSSSSGTNPCMKQLMLRIRGNLAPKSSSPKSQHSRSHRSSFWSSCICFSPLP